MAIPSAIFLIISLLLVIGNVPSSALGLLINGKLINTCHLGGIVSCPILQVNQPPKLLAGLPVELRCGSGSTDTLLRTVTTDVAGAYSIVLNLLDALLFDPSICYISVKIPPTACNINLPNPILRAPIVVLDVVQALLGSLLGNLLYTIAGPCSLLAG